jgi:hypothetical protein
MTVFKQNHSFIRLSLIIYLFFANVFYLNTFNVHAAPLAYSCGGVPDPAANRPPNPNYLSSGGESAAIQAINNARLAEGIATPGAVLPRIFPEIHILPEPCTSLSTTMPGQHGDTATVSLVVMTG